ncbi:hypothetical protein ACNGQ0_24720 [Escherichia coli]
MARLAHGRFELSLDFQQLLHLLDEGVQILFRLDVNRLEFLLIGLPNLRRKDADLVVDHLNLLLEVCRVKLRGDRDFNRHVIALFCHRQGQSGVTTFEALALRQ